MALPATENFSAAAGNLPNPPWFNAHNTASSSVATDGLGHGKPNTNTADALAVWINDAFPNDQYSQFKAGFVGLGTGLDYLYLLARATNNVDFEGASGKGYLWFSDGGSDTELQSVVSGAFTTIATANTVAYTIGDLFKLQCVGTTISVLKNGTTISGMSVTNSAAASGSAGCGGSQTTATVLFTAWEGGSLAAATVNSGFFRLMGL